MVRAVDIATVLMMFKKRHQACSRGRQHSRTRASACFALACSLWPAAARHDYVAVWASATAFQEVSRSTSKKI